MPHKPILLECLEPHTDFSETVLEQQNRITMHTYFHLTKCLGRIFGQFIITDNKDEIGAFFLSGLFNNLVYLFDFHHSLNTFYFGKVSALLLEYLQDTFMVSHTQCLGLGIVECPQGGEYLNKKPKKWRKILYISFLVDCLCFL